MADEFKDFENVPTPALVFDEAPKEEVKPQESAPAAAQPSVSASAIPGQAPTNFAAAAAAAVSADVGIAQEEKKDDAQPLNDSSLTEEERRQVESFSHQIDLRNTGAILQYGAGAQKKMADFSEKALENVKTKDMGEVGSMISGLVTELKSFDVTEEDKGILGFFKKSGNKVTAMKAKYDKASANVDKICETLEDHQIQLIKDIATLDNMYELNLTYFKELTMYILAGKKRLEEVRSGELRELNEKARASGLAEDAQAAAEAIYKLFENKFEEE